MKSIINASLIVVSTIVIIFNAVVLVWKPKPKVVKAESLIQEAVGKELNVPEKISRQLNGSKLVVYVDNNTCSPCIEKALCNLNEVLDKSSIKAKATLLIHTDNLVEEGKENSIVGSLGKYYNVIISQNDSLMEHNNWLPKNRVFYAFIFDDTDKITCCGFPNSLEMVSELERQMNEPNSEDDVSL